MGVFYGSLQIITDEVRTHGKKISSKTVATGESGRAATSNVGRQIERVLYRVRCWLAHAVEAGA